MVPFLDVCPKLASIECRNIQFLGNRAPEDIPVDKYLLMEYYCDDEDCDCRRVIFRVYSIGQKKDEATINYGFDSKNGKLDLSLEPLAKQGPYAALLLEYVRDAIGDPSYVARLERHYAITKDIVAGRLRPQDAQPSPSMENPIELPHRSPVSLKRVNAYQSRFDIHVSVLDADGEIDGSLFSAYQTKLGELFEASPEGQKLLPGRPRLGWAQTMMDLSLNHLGKLPPTMTAEDVDEVVFELFPRKVTAEASQAGEIISELRAFWSFLQREYQLENVAEIFEALGPGAEDWLREEMSNPANFGMAKSIFSLAAKAGCDISTQAGADEFIRAYNAGLLKGQVAASSSVRPKAPSWREEPMPQGSSSTREDRRAAELERRRAEKKARQRQNRR